MPGDTELAIDVFAMMAAVFEEGAVPLSRGYVDRLLARGDFWAFIAVAGAGRASAASPRTRCP